MPNIIQLRDYEPKSSHHIFLDANILLYVFSPIGDYRKREQEQITNFLSHAKAAGTSLYVTSLVLSEFYNRQLKTFFDDWKTLKENPGENIDLKKDYRPTSHYTESIKAISSSVRNILKFATKFPDSFNAINIDHVLDMCVTSDFNDAYFLALAELNGWMIFTRDRDLINHPSGKVLIITNLN